MAVLALHGLVLALLLTTLRRTIHGALLLDARALGLAGGTLVCQSCGRPTEARVLCRHRGTALRAQPKRSRVGDGPEPEGSRRDPA